MAPAEDAGAVLVEGAGDSSGTYIIRHPADGGLVDDPFLERLRLVA
jgi:hypothetical protein